MNKTFCFALCIIILALALVSCGRGIYADLEKELPDSATHYYKAKTLPYGYELYSFNMTSDEKNGEYVELIYEPSGYKSSYKPDKGELSRYDDCKDGIFVTTYFSYGTSAKYTIESIKSGAPENFVEYGGRKYYYYHTSAAKTVYSSTLEDVGYTIYYLEGDDLVKVYVAKTLGDISEAVKYADVLRVNMK